jgi:hypothetical protein
MGRSVAAPPAPAAGAADCLRVTTPDDDAGHPAHRMRVARVAVAGTATDILVQPFSDRVFVAVSQLDKLGTIVRPCARGTSAASAQLPGLRIVSHTSPVCFRPTS